MDRIQSLRHTMDDPDLSRSSREVKEYQRQRMSAADNPNTSTDHHTHQKLPQYFCLENVKVTEPMDEGFVDQRLPQKSRLDNATEPMDEGFIDKFSSRKVHLQRRWTKEVDKFSASKDHQNVTESMDVDEGKNDTMNSKKRQNSIASENLTKRIKFDQHQN